MLQVDTLTAGWYSRQEYPFASYRTTSRLLLLLLLLPLPLAATGTAAAAAALLLLLLLLLLLQLLLLLLLQLLLLLLLLLSPAVFMWFATVFWADSSVLLLLLLLLLALLVVFVSYALVSLTDAVLYTNPAKVTPPVAAQLKDGGVVVRPYEQLVPDIKAKAGQGTKIAMDLARVRDAPALHTCTHTVANFSAHWHSVRVMISPRD